MHELSLSTAVLETVRRHASGRRVKAVNLRIGRLRQVVPDALEFYWGIVTRSTECEGSRLEQDIVPVRLRCRTCDEEWEPEFALFRCPSCPGSQVDVERGDEFLVDSIVLEGEAQRPEAGRRA